LQLTWEKADRAAQYQSEQLARLRELREQLNDERQYRTKFAAEKERLEKQLENKSAIIQRMQEETDRMRGEINQLIIRANSKRNKNSSYQVKDLLGEDELQLLHNLMKAKPGFYKESDKEVGLQAS
jgi:hypothetical protein